ncbi:uncharacterized protein LOC129608054 [Condylostylus longicornis]|uniref:uncharacterized protein LOC129608054 n=1 Tax=Condylostylus longicornis TaxID=2530218 RepID=UPI00244DF63E|nr:uncharacterized protein LOC129608054 [Condylostylus longicornis]
MYMFLECDNVHFLNTYDHSLNKINRIKMAKFIKNLSGFFTLLVCICVVIAGGNDENENTTNISGDDQSSTTSNDCSSIEDIEFQKIYFGKNMVTVYESNEFVHENGTIEIFMDLENGIFLNLNYIPKMINETETYTTLGNLRLKTPDNFSYNIEFEIEGEDFNLVNFESSQIMNQGAFASAKILAALAGRR